jgi:two-component system CheB/CheR fusion protein
MLPMCSAAMYVATLTAALFPLLRKRRNYEPFLSLLFEHLPMAAAIVDASDRVLAINPAFTRLFEYTEAEALGRPLGELIVPEELRTQGLEFTERALHGELISTESVRCSRSGERIPVWIMGIVLRTPLRRKGILALYQDMRPIHQQRQQLQQLLEQAQQLMAARDRMLATISHDLRSPLAAAQGLCQLILSEPTDADQVRTHATKLAELLDYQLRLIGDLLTYFRTHTAEKLELELEEFDLCELAVQVLDALTLSAYQKQIQLVPRLPEESVPIRADRYKLQRVLTNLLTNAIKFTPSGGTVELEVTTDPTLSRPIIVRVRDTGVGIPAELLPNLFEPFSAAVKPGTGGERGTGLGLAIGKRLVELHGGAISISSQPGSGTTVEVSLPPSPPSSP